MSSDPRVLAGMIVGPGEAAKYLPRALTAARAAVDEIIAYGDGVDPATRLMLCERTDLACFSPESRFLTDESYVRNRLLSLLDLRARDGDVVIVLDADEEISTLTTRPARQVLREYARQHGQSAWPVQFHHLWNADGTVHRVDGQWQPSVGPRAYRHQRGRRIPRARMGCAAIPEGHTVAPITPELLIRHWSYARPEDRQAKYLRYRDLPGHGSEHIDSILKEPTVACC